MLCPTVSFGSKAELTRNPKPLNPNPKVPTAETAAKDGRVPGVMMVIMVMMMMLMMMMMIMSRQIEDDSGNL